MVMINQQLLPLIPQKRAPKRPTPAGKGRARKTSTAGSTAASAGGSRWSAAPQKAAKATRTSAPKRRQTIAIKTVAGDVRRLKRPGQGAEVVQPKVVAKPQPSRPRVVRELAPLPKSNPNAGVTFSRNRIRHAFEMFGSCMMILAFLVLAMFA